MQEAKAAQQKSVLRQTRIWVWKRVHYGLWSDLRPFFVLSR